MAVTQKQIIAAVKKRNVKCGKQIDDFYKNYNAFIAEVVDARTTFDKLLSKAKRRDPPLLNSKEELDVSKHLSSAANFLMQMRKKITNAYAIALEAELPYIGTFSDAKRSVLRIEKEFLEILRTEKIRGGQRMGMGTKVRAAEGEVQSLNRLLAVMVGAAR